MDEENVHPVHLQALQALLQAAQHPVPAVVEADGAVGLHQPTDFCLEDKLVTRHALQRLAHPPLGCAGAVEGRGVEEADAQLKRALDGLDGLGVGDAAVKIADGRSAHAQLGYAQGGVADLRAGEWLCHLYSSPWGSGLGRSSYRNCTRFSFVTLLFAGVRLVGKEDRVYSFRIPSESQ